MKRIIQSIIILTVYGCNSEKVVIIESYTYDNKLINKKEVRIIEKKDANSIIYLYQDVNESEKYPAFFIKKDLRNDTVIIQNNKSFYLIDQHIFRVQGKDYFVKKHLYDIPQSADEELSIFEVENFGFIIILAEAWGRYELIQNVVEKELIDKILADKTGFFGLPPFPLDTMEYIPLLNENEK